jgi:GGDEF domain-containing protein
MLNSIFRRAGKFLIGLSDGRPSTEAPRGSHTSRQSSDRAMRTASGGGSNSRKLLAGSIRLLDLDDIRRELGVNWGRASGAVYRIVEDTIAKNLLAGDIHERHGQDMFVLCFASADREAVEARMCAIVEEIKRALLKNNSGPFRVAHDVADIMLADGDEVPLIETIAKSLRQVRDEAENAAKVWREHLLRTATIRYKPVWSPKKEVVAIHRAGLDEDTGRRTMQRLSSLSSVDEMLTVLFELDCLILGHAASGLHELVGRGGRTQLIVPVNFNSINLGTRRKRYLKLCADIPSAYRRFLLFEIRDIPPGTPAERVLDLIVPLNQYAHGTVIEASVSSAVDLVDGVGSAIMGVVTRADQFSGAVADVRARLKRHVKDLKARNLRVFLHGVNTPELVREASATGIDWIDGSCVANPTRELKTLYRWNIG